MDEKRIQVREMIMGLDAESTQLHTDTNLGL